MALLIVPRESWTQSPSSTHPTQLPSSSTPANPASTSSDFGALAELVDPSLRRKVAKDVNEAILQSQGETREPKIRWLVRSRAWAEQLARDKKMDLPPRLNLGLDGDDAESGTTERNGNGHGADTDMAESTSEGSGHRRMGTGGAGGGGEGRGGGGGGGDAVMARYTNLPSS